MSKNLMLSATAIAMLLSTTLAFAGEGQALKPSQEKNLCVLYSQNCPKRADGGQDTVQDTLKKLRDEIARGEAVYTPEELRILEKKLEFEEEIWDFLN